MISFSNVPTTLLALCLLLILNTSADDSNLTDPPFGQQAAIGFSPSSTDDAFASTLNQPVLQHEADMPRLPDGLMGNTKSLYQTDGENVNCAAYSPHALKRSSRSSRRLSKRQQHDFCSFQRHGKPQLEPPPSKPGDSNIPAGEQDKAGVERPRGSMGGPNEFVPDPMLNLKESQLYGKPNSALCPTPDRRVPMCTPYDQQLTSPAPFLVPSRFWKPHDWCSEMEGDWEDLWCCAFAYVHPSLGWEMSVVFKRYPGTGIECMLMRNHYTDN